MNNYFFFPLTERALLEKKLFDKEAELVHVNAEMKTIIDHLQLDMDMLRESNNQLVADLLRVLSKVISEKFLKHYENKVPKVSFTYSDVHCLHNSIHIAGTLADTCRKIY